MSKILWRPTNSRIENSNADAFRLSVNSQHQLSLANWDALYRWSIEQPEAFWESVWSFCGVIAETQGDTTLRLGARLSDARWFPEARLNFAQNLLRRRDETLAIIFRGEGGQRIELTSAELYEQVSRLATAMQTV